MADLSNDKVYIQLGSGEYELISNTDQDQTAFVDPYDTKEKYMRNSNDLVVPWSVEDRYKEQLKRFPTHPDHVKTRLVPDLLESFTMDKHSTNINVNDLSITYGVNSALKEDQAVITVSQNGSTTIETLKNSTSAKNIALSTVKQIAERYNETFPVGVYRTKPPRYEYRGFMLDIARQFHGREVIKRQLDLMWRYKLNVLHLHLTDDESWSIDIEPIPELVRYGSVHCFDLSKCGGYPQLGQKLNEGPKYLTKSDYIDIVGHAESLGITVVPEIEMPGHATVTIQAMKLRYENSPTEEDYRLHDPLDNSTYLSVQYFTAGAVNPCVDSTYKFLDTVVTTLQSYHSQAGQTLKMIHLAGDEVASGAWTGSPACAPKFSNLSVNTTDKEKTNVVKIEMMKKLGQMAEAWNLSLGFWEDGLINKTSGKPFTKSEVFPSSVDVYGYTWQTVWEWWGGDRAFNMANDGYKVVMAPANRYYMDHSQEAHPNEHGYYWAARYTSLKSTFSFRPENYYANIDGVTVFGAPITEATWCDPNKCPPLILKENIVGVEAPLFGETIRSQDNIDNNVWPRLLAVAERAWKEGAWEKFNGTNPLGLLQQDFDIFRQVVEQYEIPELELTHNVKYHLSPPGAAILLEDDSSMTLVLSVEFKGQRVWWKRENANQFVEATDFKIIYQKDSYIYLRTSNAEANRFSYEVPFHKSRPTPEVQSTPEGKASDSTRASILSFLWIFFVCFWIL